MTVNVAVVLFVLFAIQLATVVISVKTHLTLHVVVGLLLVPPLLVKIAAVSWRFIRYYRHDEAYLRKGPPTPLLRVLGPLLLLMTLVLFVSGIVLLLAPSAFGGPRGIMFHVHDLSFYIWLLLLLVHLAGHARDFRSLAFRDWGRRARAAVPGSMLRQSVVLASLAAGLALALALVGQVGAFQSAAHHAIGPLRQPGLTGRAWKAAAPGTALALGRAGTAGGSGEGIAHPGLTSPLS
jgi:hypothetical protein